MISTVLADRIKAIDPGLKALASGDGTIFLSPGMQGRIYCAVENELVSKLDFPLAANPTPDFNNIGGNSLWPAPEGGAYAYNYPHGEWTVQDGINKVKAEVESCTFSACVMKKHISLLNAKGVNVELDVRRETKVIPLPATAAELGLKGTAYISSDSFTPTEEYSTNDVLLNAWTLEQFPGPDQVTAFGKFAKKDAKAKEIINDDFYGDPLSRITFAGDLFLFALGGEDRLQIGVKKDCLPELIGSWDPKRNILIIRKTAIEKGQYVNIADNDQKNGPFSTEDIFSVFNGASLGFYELETIAPMIVKDGKFISSTVVSETYIYKGSASSIAALLEKEYNINAKEIIK